MNKKDFANVLKGWNGKKQCTNCNNFDFTSNLFCKLEDPTECSHSIFWTISSAALKHSKESLWEWRGYDGKKE